MVFALDLLAGLLNAILALCLVGLTAVWLSILWVFAMHLRHFRRGRATEARLLAADLPADAELPAVLVQLPVYNEPSLVERALEAAARLDWPRDRLRIQLLDDSRDDTTALAEAKAAALRREGIAVEVLHRDDRAGFKAGALQAGLRHADCEFVAILDVDYVPAPDFLRRCLRPLLNPQLAPVRLGFVQARWGYLNAEASALTRVQALNMDAHFVVEQTGRCWSGLPMTFNGTCGVWRREAIEAAGGWEGDSLAEDMDLALRAYLAGWRGWMLVDVEVPGELPDSIAAWNIQQSRWTRGVAGVARKLWRRIWAAPVPWPAKLATTLQFGFSAAIPVTAAAVASTVGLLILGPDRFDPAVLALGLAWAVGAVGTIAAAAARGQRVLGRFAWPRFLRSLAGTVLLYLWIALLNARGVLATFGGAKSAFERTPKTGARPPQLQASETQAPETPTPETLADETLAEETAGESRSTDR